MKEAIIKNYPEKDIAQPAPRIVDCHATGVCVQSGLRAEQPAQKDCGCAECGKKEKDGWYLYCVDCMDKAALAQPEQCQCPNCKVTLHASDCAVHNEPAYPKRACNCGARQEQEPVAWKLVPRDPTDEMLKAMDECSTEGYDERLYAGHAASVYMAAVDVAPAPPQRTWVDLTDKEIDDVHGSPMSNEYSGLLGFVRAVLAKSKEKNNG